jgi:DNA-directed RNA polymerase specialized sigma24 family protein
VTACADDHRLGRVDPSRADDANNEPFDRTLVIDAWNRLPPLHREVVLKAYRLGWTTDRIAAGLGTTESFVKSQLHHALHTLRLILLDPNAASGMSSDQELDLPARQSASGARILARCAAIRAA